MAAGTAAVGDGRGLPPVPAPAVKANVPEPPPLSRHVPLNVASAIVASIGAAMPPGAATTLSPKPIDPLGFWNAVPMTDALVAAPHWSSVPSTR